MGKDVVLWWSRVDLSILTGFGSDTGPWDVPGVAVVPSDCYTTLMLLLNIYRCSSCDFTDQSLYPSPGTTRTVLTSFFGLKGVYRPFQVWGEERCTVNLYRWDYRLTPE